MEQIFQKNKVVTGKTPLLVAILFIVLALAFAWAVFNGNDVFLILVVSTKKQYSSFLKKVFIFQKICFQVKVLKTFETFTDCHIKNMPISQMEGYFEHP